MIVSAKVIPVSLNYLNCIAYVNCWETFLTESTTGFRLIKEWRGAPETLKAFKKCINKWIKIMQAKNMTILINQISITTYFIQTETDSEEVLE